MDFQKLFRPGILAARPYVPGKPVEEVQRELGLDEVVKLASNENPLGASPKALAAIRDALVELTRYPDGNGFALKTLLAELDYRTEAENLDRFGEHFAAVLLRRVQVEKNQVRFRPVVIEPTI